MMYDCNKTVRRKTNIAETHSGTDALHSVDAILRMTVIAIAVQAMSKSNRAPDFFSCGTATL